MKPFSQTLPRLPGATQDAWMAKVEAALKGRPAEKTLTYVAGRNLSFDAFVADTDAATSTVGPDGAGWVIVQKPVDPTPTTLQHERDAGADGFRLSAGDFLYSGLSLHTDPTSVTPQWFVDIAPEGSGALRSAIKAHMNAKVLPANAVVAALVADPYSQMAAGNIDVSTAKNWLMQEAALVKQDAGLLPKLSGLWASSLIYENSGADADTALGFVMATAVSYVRALEAAGMTAAEALAQIVFEVGTGAQAFLDIAKLRALRLLWARVAELAGILAEPAIIHARQLDRSYTQIDPHVNMLRSVAAGYGAALGGADSIELLPFALSGDDADEAYRLARNVQIILREESHLGVVSDPASGASGLEAMTSKLAEQAWAIFQSIEAAGGMLAVLENGWAQERCGKDRSARQHRLAHRQSEITGVSAFPDLSEADIASADISAHNAFPLIRDSAPFEGFRRLSDQWRRQYGDRPVISIQLVSDITACRARLRWAESLAAVGGFHTNIVPSGGAVPKSGIIWLCGADEDYQPSHIKPGQSVYILGAPPNAGDLQASGACGYITARSDIVALFTAIWADMEASR